MKKFISLALALIATTGAFAQDIPEAGSFATEIQFNPFSTNFETFKLDGAKFKGIYFLSEENALRFGIGFGVNSRTNRSDLSIPNPDNYSDYSSYTYNKDVYEIEKEDFTRTTNSSFDFSFGYERHFKTVGRLDLYAGVQATFGINCNKTYSEDNKYDTNYTGSSPYIKSQWLETSTSKNNTINFGAGVFTGLNFFVYKSLYIGTELGLEASYKSAGNKSTEWTTTQQTASEKERKTETYVKDNTISTKLFCEPSLHIGWTF